MRHFTILILIAFLLCQSAGAQDSIIARPFYFTATIKFPNAKTIKNYLDGFSDSVIFLSREKTALRYYDQSNATTAGFNYKDLESVRIRKKSATVTGIVVGAACGLFAGALLGATQNSDWFLSTGEYVIYGSFTGATLGSIIGLVCGLTAHKTFIIIGRKEKFDKMKRHLLRRAIKM